LDQEAADMIKLLSKAAVEMNLVSIVDELSRTRRWELPSRSLAGYSGSQGCFSGNPLA